MKNKLILLCLIPVIFAASTGLLMRFLAETEPDRSVNTTVKEKSTSFVSNQTTNEPDYKTAEEYDGISDTHTLINCMVTVDPEPFTSPSKADKTQLMQVAFWCVLQTGKDESYDFSSKCMLIEQSEIEKMYRSLFGNIEMPQPDNIDFQGITFTYNKKDKNYSVPITGITSRYTGKIVKEKQKNNSLIFEVQYIPKSNWTQNSDGVIVAPKAEKTMSVTLKKNNNNSFSVYSLKKG